MERAGESFRADSEGASAGKAPPVVEDLAIKCVAECRAGRAAGSAGHEACENRTGYAAAYCTNRTAERTDRSTGLCARQHRSCAAHGPRRCTDGATDASCDVPLLGAKRLARWTRPGEVPFSGAVARRFAFVWLWRLMYLATPIQR